MRDENGFKCHVASESHVRQMQLIGEDPRKAINDFSNQFLKDFMQLLRTGHGEKKVNVNHFYQEYISNKQHIHMNATKWSSLTEFAKYLGREGMCRVDEDDKNEGRSGASGLMISWIDNSPEALRRQEALRKKERQDRGDEELEQKMIREQIRRAKRDGVGAGIEDEEELDTDLPSSGEGIKRKDGEKIVLNFGAKRPSPDAVEKPPSPPLTEGDASSPEKEKVSESVAQTTTPSDPVNKPQPAKTALSFGLSSATSKPKNVFATSSKKHALSGTKKAPSIAPQRPMSEAERIMKEELERKRQRESGKVQGGNIFKKQRVS
jgi:DNA/RNA-binding protein KIN17